MGDLLFKKPLVSMIQNREGQDLNTWPLEAAISGSLGLVGSAANRDQVSEW